VDVLDKHEEQCSKMVKKEDPIKLLTARQQMALSYVMKKSKIFSKAVKYNLLEKFKMLGYSETELKLVHDYVKRDVKTVIHINLTKVLDFILNDTNYRNQFETNISGGSLSKSARDDWEKQLFNGLYLHSEGSEKVKYGALNITNDSSGVRSAHGYGNSYLVLNDATKVRTSFVWGDSSLKDLHIANYRNFYPILLYLGNNALDEIVKIAMGKQPCSTIVYGNYIEAQIHGPVRFKEDVDTLVVNSMFREQHAVVQKIEEFCLNNDIAMTFMDQI
jgi:hypothetical protein